MFLPERRKGPITVRLARSFMWAQAALALMAAAFSLVLGAVGPADTSVSPSRGSVLAYSLLAAVALAGIGLYIGRLSRIAYFTTIVVEAVLAALFAVSLGTTTASGAVGLLIAAAVLGLLWTPSARFAFAGHGAADAVAMTPGPASPPPAVTDVAGPGATAPAADEPQATTAEPVPAVQTPVASQH